MITALADFKNEQLRYWSELVEVADPPLPRGTTPLTQAPMGVVVKKVALTFVLGGGILAIGVAVAWATRGGWRIFWGIVSALWALGVFALIKVQRNCMIAACPFCHATLGAGAAGDDLEVEEFAKTIQCEGCHEYCIIERGVVRPHDGNPPKCWVETLEEIAAAAPGVTPATDPGVATKENGESLGGFDFESACYKDSVWPRACMLCGAPPTRLEDVSATYVSLLDRPGFLTWGAVRAERCPLLRPPRGRSKDQVRRQERQSSVEVVTNVAPLSNRQPGTHPSVGSAQTN